MPDLNPHYAVYVGSFDPLTLGHLDIIRRGAALFEKLTVGIGINPEKNPLFSPAERELMLEYGISRTVVREAVARLAGPRAAAHRKSRLPDPVAQLRPRRIERVAAGKWRTGQSITNNVEIIGENLCALRTVEPKGGKGRRVSAGPDPKLKTAVRQQIEDRGVLCHPDGMFQRQRNDAGAKANAGRLRRDETEKCEWRREPALAFVKMVLRDPCGIKAGGFRVNDLRCRQAISFRGWHIVEQPREKTQSLQIWQTIHDDLQLAGCLNFGDACGCHQRPPMTTPSDTILLLPIRCSPTTST